MGLWVGVTIYVSALACMVAAVLYEPTCQNQAYTLA